MERKCHYLRGNATMEQPTNLIFFDTETRFSGSEETTIYHHLKFGYACYTRRNRHGNWGEEDWLRFETVAAFWDWVQTHSRRKTKLYLFCHNTSFDLPVLNAFTVLPIYGYTLVSAIVESPPTILRYRTDTKCELECRERHHTVECKRRRREARSIVIIDTLNLFRMPLKELGKEIGLEKYEMPEDNDLTIDWETYGKRDVEIIKDAVIRWLEFLKVNNFGSFAPTLAGQSMRAFRHKYMRHKILIDNNEDALKLTRKGYYGGRCEAYFIGRRKGRFSLLDVNSMYPSIMVNELFPHKLTCFTRHAAVGDLWRLLESRCVTAEVTLNTNTPFVPVRIAAKLVFPTGSLRCILSTPELRYARYHTDIIAVHRVACYDCAPLFQSMMIDLYKMRCDYKATGNKVYAFLARKMMNSFYGKWGQAGFKWLDKGEAESAEIKHWMEIDLTEPDIKKRVRFYRQFGGLKQIKDTREEGYDSFPAIAAHITAHARMKLWEIICQAGREHVYYCDTDSVLVDEIGRANLSDLIDPTHLGFLSIKGEYGDIEIFGCKDYVFGTNYRCKGVRATAIWTGPDTVEQAKWSGLRGLLRSGNCDAPRTSRVRKHLKRIYDKAVVLPGGGTRPLVLPVDAVQDPLDL